MNILRNGHLKLWRWEVRWSVIKVAAQTKKILNTRVFERGGGGGGPTSCILDLAQNGRNPMRRGLLWTWIQQGVMW